MSSHTPGAGLCFRPSFKILAFAAAVAMVSMICAGPSRACEHCPDFDILCCDLPEDNLFYLTSFSGEGMACGGYADGAWYYTTSWVRWYCDARLSFTNPDTGACVVVQVADAGPAAWVEESAGMPIVDASPLVCRDLFDSGSCGWSDRFVVEVHQVADDTPLGPGSCPDARPCEAAVSSTEETIIDNADPCFSKDCLSHGNYWWPVGDGYDGNAVYTIGVDDDYDCWGKWQAASYESGAYTVSVHVPASDDRTTNAVYEIQHSGATDSYPVDQSAASGWVELGEITFSDSADQWIMLTDNTGESVDLDRRAIFDAVRFTPTTVIPEEPQEEEIDVEPIPDEPADTVETAEIVPDAPDDAGVEADMGEDMAVEDSGEDGAGYDIGGGCSCSIP